MVKVEKTTIYFESPGPENTDDVIEAVVKRVREGDIKTVVVASTSGATGLKFASALKERANVVAISHEIMKPENKRKILGLGAKAIDKTHTPLHAKGMDDVRNSFYTLGQGLKVAVEVILIAADKAAVTPYKDVIGVGGTSEGSDTAIVARATTSRDAFSEYEEKKLEIREVIAMPLKKEWW